MAAKTNKITKKRTDTDYVRMYYEHQYDRLAKHESSRLTLTNYVLTISALVFTFGYQNVTQLTTITGVGLPLIIIVVNIFAIDYINRTGEFIRAHRDRAREILNRYAPELIEVNESYSWRKSGFMGSQSRVEKGIHQLIIMIAFIPLALFLYQTIWK